MLEQSNELFLKKCLSEFWVVNFHRYTCDRIILKIIVAGCIQPRQNSALKPLGIFPLSLVCSCLMYS